MSRRARPRLPRYVRVYIEGVLAFYDEDRKALRRYREEMIPSPVPNYGGTGGGHGGESRPAEAFGIRLADARYLREKERTLYAVERVLKQISDLDRRLVKLVYIKRTHTVSGAAMMLNMSKTMAYDHLNAVFWAIAMELGLSAGAAPDGKMEKCGKIAR